MRENEESANDRTDGKERTDVWNVERRIRARIRVALTPDNQESLITSMTGRHTYFFSLSASGDNV